MPDYQRIPEEVSLLARERNYFRKRWQRTRDPADKAANKRLTRRLRGSLNVFRRSSRELAVAHRLGLRRTRRGRRGRLSISSDHYQVGTHLFGRVHTDDVSNTDLGLPPEP